MTDQGSEMVTSSAILRMTSDIVSAYVRNNSVLTRDVVPLINTVHQSLLEIDGQPVKPSQEPAVPIGRSVRPDHIVCLEDGKKLKMLKRHLRTAYGMTPEDYRKKWGLRADYPMVAPNYAKQRSAFAKSIGLGRSAKDDS